jgi:hypothetical protein
MFAKWRLAATFVATMLFIGTALLWVRSYFYRDAIGYGFKQNFVTCASYVGVVDIFEGNSPRLVARQSGLWSNDIPSSQFGPARRGVLDSMFEFRWVNQVLVLPAGSGFPAATMHRRIISFPMWTLLVLWAPLPLYVFFRGRRKVRWGLRKDVRWVRLRLQRQITRFAFFSAIGAASGALTASLDIAFSLWRAQWEWMMFLLILLPVVSFTIVLTRRRIQWYRALLWMSLEIGGCVSFYAATIQWVWRVFGGYRIYEPVLTVEALIIGFACLVCGAILLLFFQARPEPIKPGPYCPECGYCLIGTPRQICPECGRAFTLEELGIGPEGLVPPGAGSTTG